MAFIERLGLSVPLIQAPMAGVATPALAAAVSEAGGLGSLGLGSSDVAAAHAMIVETQGRTRRPFGVNLFVHREPEPNPTVEAEWLDMLGPLFARYGVAPPERLRPAYRSFADWPEMLAMLLQTRPAAVSFHFGLPPPDTIAALRDAGAVLLATATSVDEGRSVARAGLDAVVAQGIEAGGHRGCFEPSAQDACLGVGPLVRLLVRSSERPIVAAGGIMDGAGIAAALALGAEAAQLGTAFIACPESAAGPGYRAALAGPGAFRTRLTRSISGRPARTLPNRWSELPDDAERRAPAYPVCYHAAKALQAAARSHGEDGYDPWWAGQGAPLARSMPARALVDLLVRELAEARSPSPG